MVLCIGPTFQNYLFAESLFVPFKAKKSTTLPINLTQNAKAFEKCLFKVKWLVLFMPEGKLRRAGPDGDTPFVNCLTHLLRSTTNHKLLSRVWIFPAVEAPGSLHHIQDKWYQFHKQHLWPLSLVPRVPETCTLTKCRRERKWEKACLSTQKTHTNTSPHIRRQVDSFWSIVLWAVLLFLGCSDHTCAAPGWVIGTHRHDGYHCKKQYW